MKEVTGLEKDAKKLEKLDSGGKDTETTDSGKRKIKEERPPTKVVIRRLPPSMTEKEFRQQIDPLPPIDYMYYVSADSAISNNPFCRAYLNFIHIADVFIFSQKFDGYVFVDTRGMEYPALVEYAPFQRTPKQRTAKKKDPKSGTLESDPAYISFKEKLEAETEEKIAAVNNMKQHFFETNVEANEEKKIITTTPLLEFLRTRHMERMKAREEKRKRDLERKRARDEQRRSAKKDDDTTLVKPPVVSMSPKTEEERLLEQQTIFLRKLLGLPNPHKQCQESCNQVVDDLSSKPMFGYCNGGVMKFLNDDDSLTSMSRDFRFGLAEPKNSNGNFENAKYSFIKKNIYENNGIKLYPANDYWKRELHLNQGKRRNLWGQQYESKFSTKSKMNLALTSFCGSKYKDSTISRFDQHTPMYQSGMSEGSKCNNLDRELFDETAFPTFEESKLHKLQKHLLKPSPIYTTPIRKQSVKDIKMKFQKWSHDVTTKSCLSRKKDMKKGDLSQDKVMKASLNENDDSTMELICEALLKEDMKNKVESRDSVKSDTKNGDYFSNGYKSFVKKCGDDDIASQMKSDLSNCGSRFLISNNLKLPKAFGSGRKSSSHIPADCIPTLRSNLPKAFNSFLKDDNHQHSCHQSHRNETMICSSESSNNNPDNINRKRSPCSIIC